MLSNDYRQSGGVPPTTGAGPAAGSATQGSGRDSAAGGDPAGGYTKLTIPTPDLPKGGGGIRSIDEKFSVNAVNGTTGMNIPLPFSPGRGGFVPPVALSYNSGSGNGVFGLGWSALLPSITRKTDNRLPDYTEADIFIFSGAEDLVPVFVQDATGNWVQDVQTSGGVTVTRYRPRVDGGFERIERISVGAGAGTGAGAAAGGGSGPAANAEVYWKVTTRDNTVSVFGKSATARIADPADPSRIFSWLLEFTYDDKGNCWQAVYKPEDLAGVTGQPSEKNRLNGVGTCTNVYLKKILYANSVHFDRATIRWDDWTNFLGGISFLLETVFDYGEHDAANPQPDDGAAWGCRQDPFSVYRSGFDIRTYRLCRRVLMFHRFAELGAEPCLVRSTELAYNEGSAFTFLTSVTQKGFIRTARGTYTVKALPPVEFSYQPLGWDTTVRTLPSDSMENLPTGIDENAYHWVDLYNEGIAGVLTEQAGGWYYKSNSGDGQLDPLQQVVSKPSLTGLATGELHFQDIEGRGEQFLVSRSLEGFFELDDESRWGPFQSFTRMPAIDLHDPNVRLLDLNGDGRADILVTEDEVLLWHASLGKEGYAPYQTVRKPLEEEQGPALVFNDPTQSIVLADMSGDGLMDIVRIRYSEVVYWPNLGYGRFGAKVTMNNAPVLDTPENFHPRYVKLADLDGSGTMDIIYLGQDSCKAYYNQSGNGWSDENIVKGTNPLPFPRIDNQVTIQMIDLLGNGTASIVWSSPLPSTTPLYYIDLMGGKKPHVMTGYKNNMGKEVSFSYLPSTYYYLQDKKAGTPWITKLPFPVQCLSQVVVTDRIAKTRFTNQYSYHHGYYDHAEREFRGFGRVEQTDTEDFENFRKHSDPGGAIQIVDEGFHQPPVLTKSWFHTGAFLNKEQVLDQFAHEYYQNAAAVAEKTLEDLMPAGMTTDEWREALRACKGLLLRSEVYTPDGSAQAGIPYTTGNHSCLVRMLQPRLTNNYAVFLVLEREALTYTYERNPADPRIAHSLTLAMDVYGNVLQSATVSYGRKTVDGSLAASEAAEQSKTHVVFSQNSYTNVINTVSDHRLPVAFETMSWELTGLAPAAGDYFRPEEILAKFGQAAEIDAAATPTAGQLQRRLLGHSRQLFLKNDLSGPLAAGVFESLGLPFQSYKQSMTARMLIVTFGDKVSDGIMTGEGKYVKLGDNNYWIPGATSVYDPAHFYQVTSMTDPFGTTTRIGYDPTYRLFVQQTTDALGNVNRVVGFNYRTLSPYLVQDLNDNRRGVRTDELGLVRASFVMGKDGENKGDLMEVSVVEASPNDQPGVVHEYDLDVYRLSGGPTRVKVIERETHFFDGTTSGAGAPGGGAAGPISPTQVSYIYMAGGGEVLLEKKQAEPGIALQLNADGTASPVDTSPNLRWIGNGRTIVNNKGLPVKQYEPYFSVSPDFEDARALVELGVTPIHTYDSAGRLIRTDVPDGTLTRVEFDAWQQKTFDANDTVLESSWYADRITKPVPGIATPEEIAAATKAAAHAGTPTVSYLDSLGRAFLVIADNGAAGKYRTTTDMDILGNVLRVKDARGNVVMQYFHEMLGAVHRTHSMDAGDRWSIPDVMGQPVRRWDSRNTLYRYQYDVLHRLVKTLVTTQSAPMEINAERTVYGEGVAGDRANNLRGKVYQHFDQSGVGTTTTVDFKNNVLQSSRQLCSEYHKDIDWNAKPALDEAVFVTSFVYDALNRPVNLTSPDQSVYVPAYNERGVIRSIGVRLRGAAAVTNFVQSITYDEKGQRQSVVYGNGTRCGYQYDPVNFRLTQLQTTGRNGADLLQQLRYTYDPAGNITTLRDDAQATLFFNNNVVTPSADYTYDALYRLTNAAGREHIGQNQPVTALDGVRMDQPLPGDGAAMRNYTQSYQYDAVGNILQLAHSAGTGSWTRTYQYTPTNNRLVSHTVGTTTEILSYDAHGNIQNQQHLNGLVWNYKDELRQIGLGGGGTAFYTYGGGQRSRKVIERQDGTKEERIYLGGFELYRLWSSAGVIQEQTETLHVMDDTAIVAMVETKITKAGSPVLERLTRYQYANHLGSAMLELDDNAVIISYEEYYPFGSTSYQAVNAAIRTAVKRYRYTGMERDDESGLEYHGARYYLPWLGRWLSADPIGTQGGLNLYAYGSNNPIVRTDTAGTDDHDIQWGKDEADNNIRKARLESYRQPLASGIYLRKGIIEDTLEAKGDIAVLRHYGYLENHWWRRQITYQDAVVAAIDAYLIDYEKVHLRGATAMHSRTPAYDAAQAAAKEDTEQFVAGVHGQEVASQSLGGSLASGGARYLTKDQKKIAAAAEAGSSLENVLTPLAQKGAQAYAARRDARQNQPSEPPPESASPASSSGGNYKGSKGRGGRNGQPSGTTPFPVEVTNQMKYPTSRGETEPNMTFKEPGQWRWRLRTPQYKPTIRVRPNLAYNETNSILDHEDQHGQDFLDHPQLMYLGNASKMPGHGMAQLWLELRGYRRQYGGLQLRGAWSSMTTRGKVYLSLEAGTVAAILYHLIF